MVSLVIIVMATSTAISKLKVGVKEKLHLSTVKQHKTRSCCVGRQSILVRICLQPSFTKLPSGQPPL